MVYTTFGSFRAEADYLGKFNWGRGINWHAIFENDFGDIVPFFSDFCLLRQLPVDVHTVKVLDGDREFRVRKDDAGTDQVPIRVDLEAM
ncbi:hypothetical protein CONLIGDRAFT_686821 [Coniochaeta ligniaria NRRL 30616]|uniref:Uncharacterized protein n=1 Tax=Coniochaeta ligniaria NRRL 30616 TaxID=1408157 RepID=A0A1J7I6W4_9PEZI|nr:hypothetical protein CONLIGDRAFT_686821 [Coniochaeta ligniaria NRRL 30616]